MPRAFEYTFGWGYTLTAIVENAETLFATCGVLVLVGGLAGLLMTVLRPGQDLGANARIAACALVIAVWVFQLIVPAGLDSRFLIPLLPPFAILAVWAAERAASAVAASGWGGPCRHPHCAGLLPAGRRVPARTRGSDQKETVWSHCRERGGLGQ